MIFVCHVTLQDHVIRTLCELEPFKISHHPTKFRGRSHCDSGDIMVLVFHVISQDHVIGGS